MCFTIGYSTSSAMNGSHKWLNSGWHWRNLVIVLSFLFVVMSEVLCLIIPLTPITQVPKFPFLGRVRNTLTTMKDSTFESKAYGKRVNKVISIEGRVKFDLFQVRINLSYTDAK